MDRLDVNQNVHPLVVDLDGSLLKTDLLFETFLAWIQQNPFHIFLVLFWFFQGRALLKEKLAQRVTLDVATLPYRAEVLAYIQQHRAQGGRVLLATASHGLLVQKIAAHLQLFDDVLATGKGINLKGVAKLIAIQGVLGKDKPFAYIGDSLADLVIWKHCAYPIVVDPHRLLTYCMKPMAFTVLDRSSIPAGRILFHALRVYQWSKNVLIFVPLFAAHRFFFHEIKQTVIAFFSFSMCASSIYIVNDLFDLNADRQHVYKKNRPIASGRLSVSMAIALMSFCFLLSCFLAFYVNSNFFKILMVYLVTSLFYSFYLKKKLLLDVICLTNLYTLRILAGGLVAQIFISNWLLIFSLCFFYGLAMLKRFAELSQSNHETSVLGRAYFAKDAKMVSILGVSGSFLSVLVFALYLNSPEVSELYSHTNRLWFVIPVLLYWLSRVWILADRGVVHEDPVLFAIRDPSSYWTMIILMIVLSWAC